MFVGRFPNFTTCYLELVKLVSKNHQYESAPRGQKIRECLGVSFTIENPRDRMLFAKGRKFSPVYLAAELLWYLSGNDKTAWISKYSNFWSGISDDGKTANSAYGARLFQPHERISDGNLNQWEFVVNELTKDPDSRRAVMHLRVPEDSVKAKLDVPCTLALQFLIRNGALHQIVHMRSSDVILGIAYDIPAFTLFQEIMANELGVELGTYTHVSNSLHIYERHFEMASEILSPANLSSSLSWSRNGGECAPICNLSLAEIRAQIIVPMMRDEEALWQATERWSVLSALNCGFTLNTAITTNTMWEDMLKLLAIRRLRVLGHKTAAEQLRKNLDYRGYTFFDGRK